MNNNSDINNIDNINKIYKNLSYTDHYGGSIILFVIITIVVSLLVSYFYTMANVQPVIDNWPVERCKPNIIPFAGLINKPDNMSIGEYTTQNFTYCMQNILQGVSQEALKPLTFITGSLQSMADNMQSSIQNSRGLMDNVRTSMQSVTEEIMGRLLNVMMPIIQIFISFKDSIAKMQGVLTTSLYSFLGSYFALRSLMGVIAKFIVTILVTLAAMIATFWLFPFTWGAAIANTSIFVAIAIPMAIILSFMNEVLHVDTGSYKIPKVKCFDKDTLLKMNDGSYKQISDVCVGDSLCDNNIVTAKFKVATEGSDVYLLNNIFVSDSHIVKCGEKWIPVSKHPMAIKHSEYNEPFLYCLNTTNKTIKIHNTLFTDWDEIYDETLLRVINNDVIPITHTQSIHKFLDYGFKGPTRIVLKDGSVINLCDVKVDDILFNGEKVYGIVEIDGSNISNQYIYDLGDNYFIEGRSIDLEPFKMERIEKFGKLYNILTDTGTFQLENIIFRDYNSAIDQFLEI